MISSIIIKDENKIILEKHYQSKHIKSNLILNLDNPTNTTCTSAAKISRIYEYNIYSTNINKIDFIVVSIVDLEPLFVFNLINLIVNKIQLYLNISDLESDLTVVHLILHLIYSQFSVYMADCNYLIPTNYNSLLSNNTLPMSKQSPEYLLPKGLFLITSVI
jgi:hypothetical protein